MIVSILESLYLIYMFCFFETSVDFNISATPDGYWFKHLIGSIPGNRICPFGHIAIFLLVGVLLFRDFIPKSLITVSLMIAFIISLINLNATIYLIPVFIIEYYRNVYYIN
jgi:hypothetical protein